MKHSFLFLALIFISGCELLPKQQSTKSLGDFDYPSYFLMLKELDDSALLKEVTKLKVNKIKQTDDMTANDVKLALLYTLPSSPVYNLYNAKDIINQLSPELSETANNQKSFNQSNKAFLLLLKDFLNQQLILLEKNKQQKTQLQQEIELLNNQINQLKAIENNLNKRS